MARPLPIGVTRPGRGGGGWSKERGGAQGGAKGGAPLYKRRAQGGWKIGRRIGAGFCLGLAWSVVPVLVPDCRVGGLSLAEGQSVRSRDPAGGTERLPFPPVRTEIAAKTGPFPQNPVRAVGRTTRATRGTSLWTTPEGLGVAIAGGGLDDTHREVATSFSFGFCVNVCVWRQSVEVVLYKCCRVKHIRLLLCGVSLLVFSLLNRIRVLFCITVAY